MSSQLSEDGEIDYDHSDVEEGDGGGFEWPDVLMILAGALTVSQARWLGSLASDPVGTLRETVAVIVVDWFFVGWTWVLDTLWTGYNTLASGAHRAIVVPVQAVASPLYTIPRSFMISIRDSLIPVLESMGIAAPVAVFIYWGISAALVAAIVWMLYGVLETYVPTRFVTRPLAALRGIFGGGG